MKYNFNDSQEFARLEDKAIDCQLDYSDFPPAEYKYFSKLARLGYNNRHKGWDIKICLEWQEKIKSDYISERDDRDRYSLLSKRIQDNIKLSADLVRQIYKSDSAEEIVSLALKTIECLTNENGFADRISNKLNNLQNMELYNGNLRLLVDEIKIYESDKKLRIEINLKAKFTKHYEIYGESGVEHNLILQG